MRKFTKLITAATIVLGLGALVLAPAATTYALDPVGEIIKGTKAAGSTGNEDLGASIKNVVNVLLFILGAIAVIVIVVGGIRYATSGGDSTQVTAAKNTILYAVVGLVVAILAYAIVNFVLRAFK